MNKNRWLPDLLPRELLTSASLDPQGLPAWGFEDAIRVAEAAPRSGLAILGGEVWWMLDNGLFHDLMPFAGGGWQELDEWDLDPIRKQPSETWTDYCERGAKYTLEILAKLRSQEELVEPTLRSRFLYHLALWTPQWYDREWSSG